MSVFRNASLRLKRRDKAHRPPPLEATPEHNENAASGSRASSEGNHLAVPESAHSNFFNLSSGMSSRSSLFGRSSTSTQEEKQRGFFKLPNLSKGSFVLRRERDDRKSGSLDTPNDPNGSFVLTARELRDCGYMAQSKRRESASMSNLLPGPDVIDISAPAKNPTVRQRSRTLSTRSVPDTADVPLRALADLPPLALPALTGRTSAEVIINPNLQPQARSRLSLDTQTARVLPFQLPSFLSPMSELPSPIDSRFPSEPENDLTITARTVPLSPSPTIVSAASASTIQDSLLSSYEVSSSESDPDQSFTQGDEDCIPIDLSDSSVGGHDYLEQALACPTSPTTSPTKHIPPRLTLTPSAQTSAPKRPGPIHFNIPGSPSLPDVTQTPFNDPFEPYFSPEHQSSKSTSRSNHSPSDPSSSRLEVPRTPTRGVSVNVSNAGNTPPARKVRTRKPEDLKLAPSTSQLKPESPTLLTVPQDDPPPTPSFLVGLAWPRPPLRQIYIDRQNPEASWHAVSRSTDERLIDGTGMVNVDPCHVIMGPGVSECGTTGRGRGTRRRSGFTMGEQHRLEPAAVSALALFAQRSGANGCA